MSDARSVWQLADLLTPMAVRVAATLRLADHLAGGRRTAAELATLAGAHPGALERLLRHLATVGIVEADPAAGGTWSLTPLGETLRDDHPSRIRARLDAESQLGRGDLAAVHLLHSVRTGEAAYPVLWGRGYWDDLAADPARTAAFDAEMGADAARWAASLVDTIDWAALGHVVDVGGGNGTLLIELLRRYPDLRGTVVDQPATAEAAQAAIAAAGLADRADAVGQSFFDPLPTGGGAYVLCAVVHNWDDERALAVLSRCTEAADASGGRVLVVEKIGTDGATPGSATDLSLLIYQGGAERSLDDLNTLVGRAGLRVEAVHHAGAIAVVVGVPLSRTARG